MIGNPQSEFYGFISQRLARTATGDQHHVRLGAIKMTALFASNGNPSLHESIIAACLKDGILECETGMFLPLLREVVNEVTGE